MKLGGFHLLGNKIGAGINFQPVQEGLILWLDGIDNEANGIHNNSATTWVNKVLGNIVGTLGNSPVWGTDHLTFNGSNQYVNLGKLDLNKATLEAVFETTTIAASGNIISSLEAGGYGLLSTTSGVGPILRIAGAYRTIYSPITINIKYHILGTYDGATVNSYLNGVAQTPVSIAGYIQNTATTYTMIGTNPKGADPNNEYWSGKIYSIKVYSRALSVSEVANNYAYEKFRYAIP